MPDEKHVRETKTVPAQDRATERREARIDRRAERRAAGDLTGQRARTAAERFLERALVGAIYAVAVIVCLWFGTVPTAVAIAVMSWLATSEFFHLMRAYGRMPNEVLGLAAAVAFPLSTLFARPWFLLVLFLLTMSVGAWYVSNPRSSITDVAVTMLGPCYVGLLYTSVVWMRAAPDGFWLAFGAVGSVWTNDAAAYIVGSKLGRHKMAPKISPKKSWEGFAGGLVGTLVIWVILAFVWKGGNLGVPLALGLGLVVCLASVLGDLVESRIKRGAGVKDSGSIMPGHGGMLDRCDSQLFACMTAYVLLRLLGLV